MDYTVRLGENAVVPVVVIEDSKDAVGCARALLSGGIDVMEITLRTAAGLDSIKKVSEEVPEMLVGAGTVISLEQCKMAVEAGAAFIVTPGFNDEVVSWCVENEITVTPGCVTPTEIMAAMKYDLKVIKFFPANIYGGLTAMGALSGPFGGIKFIPTGGVNGQNIGEYAMAPYVHTVGGSWVCAKKDISEGKFDKITELCREAVSASLGFEIAHVGINTQSEELAKSVSEQLVGAFNFNAKEGNSSIFAGSQIEVMKSVGAGANGHIAVRTNNIKRALTYLVKKGFEPDTSSSKYKGDKLVAIYLKGEIGDFAIHLLQK